MEKLALAVILRRLKDLDHPRLRHDALKFFSSAEFLFWADVAKLQDINLDPMAIQQQVNTGTYQRVSIRASYR